MRKHLKMIVVLAISGCWISSVNAEGGLTQQTSSKESQVTAVDNSLALGKQLFVESCSSCHWERGNKPLSRGKPLSERTLTREDITRAVRGRLKDLPEEQKQAVVSYIETLTRK